MVQAPGVFETNEKLSQVLRPHDSQVARAVDIGVTVETNGGLPVNIQDQTSPPVDTYFLRQLGSFSLAADTVASGATTLNYTFTATTGHGLVAGNEIQLLDLTTQTRMFAMVTNVATDTITLDRPIDHVFPAAATIAQIVSSDMAVDGSVTPVIFTVRAGTNPVDITRLIFHIDDNGSMDDGKFGSLAPLTNGLVFRFYDTKRLTIFNWKTNGEVKHFSYDGQYTDSTLGPSGQESFSSRISFGGQSKHGVVLRISDDDVLQFIVQDDLSSLGSVQVVAQGHEVTD